MTKLNFEFIEDGGTYGAGYQAAEYRGLVVEVHQDSDPMNPFEDMDGNPPTIVYSGRSDWNDYANGECEAALAAISDGRLLRHWQAIAKALDLFPNDVQSDALESQRDYGGRLVDIKREAFESALDDMKPGIYGGNAGDYLEALAALWAIAGRVAVAWSSSGYSQGDYADGISVATQAWEELTGAPVATHADQCEAMGTLWGAWAWGDVYGYVVKGPGGVELDEFHDSCWGYYGTEHGESGLEESAIDAADCILASVRKARADRLRTLVANRVPLDRRACELALVTGELESLFSRESVA